jgi:hypothetical protein
MFESERWNPTPAKSIYISVTALYNMYIVEDNKLPANSNQVKTRLQVTFTNGAYLFYCNLSDFLSFL